MTRMAGMRALTPRRLALIAAALACGVVVPLVAPAYQT